MDYKKKSKPNYWKGQRKIEHIVNNHICEQQNPYWFFVYIFQNNRVLNVWIKFYCMTNCKLNMQNWLKRVIYFKTLLCITITYWWGETNKVTSICVICILIVFSTGQYYVIFITIKQNSFLITYYYSKSVHLPFSCDKWTYNVNSVVGYLYLL